MHISGMHLTAHTDYAMRILMFAASRAQKADESRFSVEMVSAAFAISRNHAMKIVQRLANAGYLRSIRGRGGGLVLGKSAESLRLGQLIRFLEQDQTLVACFGDKETCRIGGQCVLQGALQTALNAFYHSLDSLTLADLVLRPALMQRLQTAAR